MAEKRERRCGTCAAWDGDAHSVEEKGYCRARCPEGLAAAGGFVPTDKDEWCLVDYTPFDMMNGGASEGELLARIQGNMTLLERQWAKISKLEDRIDSLADGAEAIRNTLEAIERPGG